MLIDEDAYILHSGVKGMKWGVRKKQDESSGQKAKMSKGKKAAIILGSAALAGSVVAGGIYAKKHFGVKVSDIPKPKKSTVHVAEALAKEPVGLVVSSRGRNKGYMFPSRGGLSNPLREHDLAGLETAHPGDFRRYGAKGEKAAVTFLDPLGRKDAAGRVIPHSVMFPEADAKGINSYDDAVKAAWPRIKHIVGALYESEPDRYGPGF